MLGMPTERPLGPPPGLSSVFYQHPQTYPMVTANPFAAASMPPNYASHLATTDPSQQQPHLGDLLESSLINSLFENEATATTTDNPFAK